MVRMNGYWVIVKSFPLCPVVQDERMEREVALSRWPFALLCCVLFASSCATLMAVQWKEVRGDARLLRCGVNYRKRAAALVMPASPSCYRLAAADPMIGKQHWSATKRVKAEGTFLDKLRCNRPMHANANTTTSLLTSTPPTMPGPAGRLRNHTSRCGSYCRTHTSMTSLLVHPPSSCAAHCQPVPAPYRQSGTPPGRQATSLATFGCELQLQGYGAHRFTLWRRSWRSRWCPCVRCGARSSP